MELKILKETEMPLLSRKRINLEINFDGATPSQKEVLSSLSTKLKTKEELIDVRHIYTKFGEPKAKVIAHIYNTIEDLKDIEEIKKKKKEVKENAKEEKKE
ncbi:hypothetical protein HYX17_02870 [Candidatus Woesearchaeota archaeon]|nr:hypothetical protein [Candidatus Woesearchaeota archaeon]